ncbi:hypothetical protein K2173_025507 [Erythroxylum novogranatense]|uniref:SHSP domain-containing protein n=1 Tax=Erythroxylum novogranatense TaxID=1862640 RepID=A0AAV8T8K9_9ROSI|nr:hypothetical protein K2173_025507 [Erythroxylum novogranatense]
MEAGNLKPSYEDFEPFCRWQREKDHDTLEVHLQGFKKENLKVQINDSMIITITGESRQGGSPWRRFRKDVKLTKHYKQNEVWAKFKREILYVILPKKDSPRSGRSPVFEKSESLPSTYLCDIETSSFSRLKMNSLKWAMLTGALVVVLAFGIYAYNFMGSS